MYISKVVEELYTLYVDIIEDQTILNVPQQLTRFSQRLNEAYNQGQPIALVEINNWHPECIGRKSFADLPRKLSSADIQLTIAKAYHYPSWQEAIESKDQFDWTFEEAVDLIVNGEFENLEQLLSEHPYLTQARSSYGHRAGLIHYVGSNGVEMWRQKVPDNLLEITKNLIEHGADPNMESKLYGGGARVIGLIESSAHPRDAGIHEELIALFKS